MKKKERKRLGLFERFFIGARESCIVLPIIKSLESVTPERFKEGFKRGDVINRIPILTKNLNGHNLRKCCVIMASDKRNLLCIDISMRDPDILDQKTAMVKIWDDKPPMVAIVTKSNIGGMFTVLSQDRNRPNLTLRKDAPVIFGKVIFEINFDKL